MPSPKSGNPGCAVAPLCPKVSYEADNADPGYMCMVKGEQKQGQYGKYGAPVEKPYKKSQYGDEKKSQYGDEEKKSWIEIELVDNEGHPVPGEPFKVTLPDGSVYPGTLNEKGFCRIDGIDPGTCHITFPNLDKDAWEPYGGGGNKGGGGYGGGG